MKKVCFISIVKTINDLKSEWIIQNNKPFDICSELLTSFYQENYPIELVEYADADIHTSIIVSFSTNIFYENPAALVVLKNVFDTNCKNIFVDLSSYDNQEISTDVYDFCRKECNRELYFLDKNLISVSNDIIYYEQHMWHAIHNLISNDVLNSFNTINKWEKRHIRPFKGLFLSGHIRFHKIQLLNYFYEKNLLENNFIWSSTDENWEPDCFDIFVPKDKQDEYRKFKILERVPHWPDFDSNELLKTKNYSPNVNISHYLNTYFEIILETQFYHKDGNRKDWNNISEKTFKAIRMGNPFIMVSKPNTLKLLKDKFGFDFEMNDWLHEYDTIEDDVIRMNSISKRIETLLSGNSLHDLYYKYIETKNNNTIFIENFYKQTLKTIYNKF